MSDMLKGRKRRLVKRKVFEKMLAFGSMLVLLGVFSFGRMDLALATGRAIVMSPMSQKVILSPGEVYQGGFIISNPMDSEEGLPYVVEVSSFYPTSIDVSDNDDYGGADYSSKTDLNQIVDWIKVKNPTGVIAPGQEITVMFSIDVPEDASAGGQYAAFLVRENPEFKAEDGVVAINEVMQMAHIIYANVAGETREEGAILSNNIPSIVMNNTLEATSMVRNDGNIHTDAEYVLQVWPVFSDEEICTNEENISTSFVMPNTERYHTETCSLPSVGIYKAKQTVKIFGETSIVEKIVIMCPLWLMFLVIFAIAAIIIYFVARAKARKSPRKAETE